jgi:hypothetical protein
MATKQFEGEEFKFPDEKEADSKTKLENVSEADEFQFEIEDDTPPADRGRKPAPPPDDPTDEELASYDEKVQSRIKKFTRGYHDERRAKESAQREREAAEEYARKVAEENKRLKEQLASGSKQFIETSKSAAEIKLAAAKKKYKEAFDSADADAMADANSEITEATYELREATRLKPIEVDDKEFEPAPVKPAQLQLSPRTKRWMDSNSDWWGKDEEMTMAAMGIDKKLAREYGSDYVGSEEYFKTIDKTMRKRFPEFFDTQSEDDEPPPNKRAEPVSEDDESPRRAQKPASVVAPASRSSSPNRVRLKASEAALARKLGVPLEEYAKQVAKLARSN